MGHAQVIKKETVKNLDSMSNPMYDPREQIEQVKFHSVA